MYKYQQLKRQVEWSYIQAFTNGFKHRENNIQALTQKIAEEAISVIIFGSIWFIFPIDLIYFAMQKLFTEVRIYWHSKFC